MENKNKCFFSIRLENGITITGNSPDEVNYFLHCMHDAFFKLSQHYHKLKYKSLEAKSSEIFYNVDNALKTLNNHLNK